MTNPLGVDVVCRRCDARLPISAAYCGLCGDTLLARGSSHGIERSLNTRYTIGTQLGQGGFSRVFRGTQLSTGRAVAIKMPRPEYTHDRTIRSRLYREARVLAMVRDRHSVLAIDFDRTPDGTPFVVLELLGGIPLRRFVEQGPMPLPQVRRVIRGLCRSLAELHALGFVHRDVKPDNVFVDGAGEIKLIDFGIAKRIAIGEETELTAIGHAVGTREYMSLEQLLGEPIDARTDVYALGVVAYEMLTGYLPFPDGGSLSEDPPAPLSLLAPGVPRAIERAIVGALAPRDRRIACVSELADAFEAKSKFPSSLVTAPMQAEGQG